MLIKVLYRAARQHRPRTWPLSFTWSLVLALVFRGVVSPLAWRLDCLRRTLARGRVQSRFWTPRVGDRVRMCLVGVTTVAAVSVRDDEVISTTGHRCSLRECCDPVEVVADVAG